MNTLTSVHVAISLAGILSGFIVTYGLLTGKQCHGWTVFFLATTIATSVTGFLFPIHHFTPALGLGIFSLLVLAVAMFALFVRHLVGPWRSIYVVSAVFSLYLNVFALIAQIFLKVPVLHALAPTGAEPSFLITQAMVLSFFITVGIVAVIRFGDESLRAA